MKSYETKLTANNTHLNDLKANDLKAIDLKAIDPKANVRDLKPLITL